MDVAAKQLLDEPDRPIHVSARDVSHDVLGATQLAASERQWRVAFEQSPIGGARLDADGGILVVHRALCRMLGYRSTSSPAWTSLRDSLSGAVEVLDAFHVVKLGTAVVDEVRRRVQQEQLGHRGHKDDPLYKIRGLLRHGAEHLTERQRTKLLTCLHAGDPNDEVAMAWS